MSLLTDMMEDCIMLNKSIQEDGYGGYEVVYSEGVTFKAAVSFDMSMNARTAEAQGVKSRYTVTTDRGMIMQFHDVFKRVRDDKIFRVTTDGDDKFTPASATLDMRQVEAEEWSLPANG